MGEEVPRPSADAPRAALVGALARVARRSSGRGRVARVRRGRGGVSRGSARARRRRRPLPRPAAAHAARPTSPRRATTTTTRRRPRSWSTSSARCGAAGSCACRAGARVVDAIAAAGGATPDADLTRLNLAARARPTASRVAVPRVGAPAPAVDPAAVSGARRSRATRRRAGGRARRSTSTPRPREQLDALPGVGPATAAAIVSDRDAHGPFRSVDDLGRVRGIGDAKLEQLRDLVTV